MSPTTQPDQEPSEPDDVEQSTASKGKSARRSFSKLRRELSDEELSSPAVQRMLLDEIERLDNELIEVHHFRNRFHTCDKDLAALQERFKSKVSIEVVHVACIVLGGVALGYATSNWGSQPIGWIALVFGAVLVLAGIIAKAVKP